VFKKLIFDLSGKLLETFIKRKNMIPCCLAQTKTNKFYKGASPPTTINVLIPVVQVAVIDKLGLKTLNWAKKSSEKTKWWYL
jgi:hypothetical protein